MILELIRYFVFNLYITFVFAVPAVRTQPIQMHACHPPPSHVTRQQNLEEGLIHEVSHKLDILHPIVRGQLLQFPEVRLIQYDCGMSQHYRLLRMFEKIDSG